VKILLVDDEHDIRRIAFLSLTRLGGMDVVEASSGVEALAKAETERPDAILLDMMMPLMDGVATFAALRGQPATATIPVIFLTAKAMKAEVDRLKAMGAIAVLTKPFDPAALPEQVRAACRSAAGSA
jgi:CheY-like chemotaxis protein